MEECAHKITHDGELVEAYISRPRHHLIAILEKKRMCFKFMTHKHMYLASNSSPLVSTLINHSFATS